jgi:hypothetical protein
MAGNSGQLEGHRRQVNFIRNRFKKAVIVFDVKLIQLNQYYAPYCVIISAKNLNFGFTT